MTGLDGNAAYTAVRRDMNATRPGCGPNAKRRWCAGGNAREVMRKKVRRSRSLLAVLRASWLIIRAVTQTASILERLLGELRAESAGTNALHACSL